MIQAIMEILFALLMALLFLPKYKCCMNESFLSKVSINSNGNVTCVVELLILLLILNKLTEFRPVLIIRNTRTSFIVLQP